MVLRLWSTLAPLFVVGLLGCPSKPPPGPSTDGPEPPGADAGADAGADEGAEPPGPAGPGVGEPCGDNDSCAAELECVHYFGIAGPNGPEFRSCERRCAGGGSCPEGQVCQTIADGPGEVCRPGEP